MTRPGPKGDREKSRELALRAAALADKGVKVARIAKTIGVSRAWTYKVIERGRAIADEDKAQTSDGEVSGGRIPDQL